ncbi:MAG: hypothetical protein NTY12_01550 [Candidatus Falkowbacteria bacterium]|nr:hypothetical protein [Candidatus Falkowbacteria bacterium]
MKKLNKAAAIAVGSSIFAWGFIIYGLYSFGWLSWVRPLGKLVLAGLSALR